MDPLEITAFPLITLMIDGQGHWRWKFMQGAWDSKMFSFSLREHLVRWLNARSSVRKFIFTAQEFEKLPNDLMEFVRGDDDDEFFSHNFPILPDDKIVWKALKRTHEMFIGNKFVVAWTFEWKMRCELFFVWQIDNVLLLFFIPFGGWHQPVYKIFYSSDWAHWGMLNRFGRTVMRRNETF